MKKLKYIKIEHITYLKAYLNRNKRAEFLINLGNGLRSSKELSIYKTPTGRTHVQIINDIDGSIQRGSFKILKTRSNISEAMIKGNFYLINERG